jgi:hypothetical protein
VCGAAQALARQDPTTSPPESSKLVLDKLGAARKAVGHVVHENQDFNAIRDGEFTHAWPSLKNVSYSRVARKA